MQHTAMSEGSSPDPAKTMERVLQKLKFHCGEAVFNSWLKNLRVNSVGGNQVAISAPTRFVREWVLSHYADDILSFWQEENPDIFSLDIIVHSSGGAKNITENHEDALLSRSCVTQGKLQESSFYLKTSAESVINMDRIGSELDPRFTFDSFVAGSSNELAFAAAKSIVFSKESTPGTNPLYIHGGVGLGKTHLLQAVACEMKKEHPEKNILYLTAEKFMFLFVQALRNKDIIKFKEQFRAVDVLLMDDIQFICGKGSTQEEFFHLLNTLLDTQRQLVISGSKQPGELDGLDDRVKSRLSGGLVADIGNAEYNLRLDILSAKARQMSCDIPEEVLKFLAAKITSNIRELEGALNKIIVHSRLMKRTVTLEGTQNILQNLLRVHERIVTISDIQKIVSEHYKISLADMRSSRRARCIARPRQMAMYLSKKLTTNSLPEIGRQFGGKDHTTVMHAVKRVEQLLEDDAPFREDAASLTNRIQHI